MKATAENARQTPAAAATLPARLIAMYLPQYHPIPENDKWWGVGFTEWRNVTKAKPLFPGHYQPHLPGDLGFYDLRLPEAREAQAALARQYGIHGLCYYHYWFNGRRILNRPMDEMIAAGKPDLPFCVCWANENWTRAWDGRSREVLLEQHYSDADDLEHIRFLATILSDPRYIRVDGKPMLLLYRASLLPDARRTVQTWRDEFRRLGLGELYLVRVQSMVAERNDPTPMGFDAAMDFQPDWSQLGPSLQRTKADDWKRKLGLAPQAYAEHRVYEYEQVVQRMLARPQPPYLRLPAVAPGWDNSARRAKDAVIFNNCDPAVLERWLTEVIRREQQRTAEPIVFVNAWNEWAEGNHLEPDLKHGLGYLEAVQRALRACATAPAVSANI